MQHINPLTMATKGSLSGTGWVKKFLHSTVCLWNQKTIIPQPWTILNPKMRTNSTSIISLKCHFSLFATFYFPSATHNTEGTTLPIQITKPSQKHGDLVPQWQWKCSLPSHWDNRHIPNQGIAHHPQHWPSTTPRGHLTTFSSPPPLFSKIIFNRP